MIDLDTEIKVSAIVVKGLVLKAVEIDRDSNHIIILLQIVMLRFNIRCLKIVVFLLVSYLVDVVFKGEYLEIFCHKF